MYRRINDRLRDDQARDRPRLVAGLASTHPRRNHGAIAGATTIVAHPEAKRSLHMSTGALAVDNESHVVASVAAARRLPMAAVRVIMDPAGRQLPAAALASVRKNGTIDPAALVRAIVGQPGELPMLLRTALDARIGFAALLRCRQLLGPGLGAPFLKQLGSEPGRSLEVATYCCLDR